MFSINPQMFPRIFPLFYLLKQNFPAFSRHPGKCFAAACGTLQKAIPSGFRLSDRRQRTAEAVLIINLLAQELSGVVYTGAIIRSRLGSCLIELDRYTKGGLTRAVLSSSSASFTTSIVPHFSHPVAISAVPYAFRVVLRDTIRLPSTTSALLSLAFRSVHVVLRE